MTERIAVGNTLLVVALILGVVGIYYYFQNKNALPNSSGPIATQTWITIALAVIALLVGLFARYTTSS